MIAFLLEVFVAGVVIIGCALLLAWAIKQDKDSDTKTFRSELDKWWDHIDRREKK